jgi:hypothetical protein
MTPQSKRHCYRATKADSIVNLAIEAHGGKLYNDADYSFEFRGKIL